MPFDDAKTIRALAHPVRIALLEALVDAGTLTATEAGEHVGESPANASFHLRQLAKYGFVEEAEGGTGRRRPWQLAGSRPVTSVNQVRLFLTPDEVKELEAALLEVLGRHADRKTPWNNPPGAARVEIVTMAYRA
jgi:DNA-binding transcriptional ArsR family regulator